MSHFISFYVGSKKKGLFIITSTQLPLIDQFHDLIRKYQLVSTYLQPHYDSLGIMLNNLFPTNANWGGENAVQYMKKTVI